MKKLLFVAFACAMLSGCINTDYMYEQGDYNYDYADNYFDEDKLYIYDIFDEAIFYDEDYDSYVGEHYKDRDIKQVKKDLQEAKTSKYRNAFIDNMVECEDVVITKYGEDNARVYYDSQIKQMMIMEDEAKNTQIYNSVPQVPERYVDIIKELSDEFIYSGLTVNSEDTDRAVLKFFNIPMYVILGDSRPTIYSTSYGDMDIVYKYEPIMLELYMDGDDIAKLKVVSLNQAEDKCDNRYNVQCLAAIPQYGQNLSDAYAYTENQKQSCTGKNGNLQWKYKYNVANLDDFNASVLFVDF